MISAFNYPTPCQIVPLTTREVREAVERINSYVEAIGHELLVLKEAEAWKVLGYQSWTKFLEGEFVYSRKHLYDLMRASPVTERLQQVGYDHVPTKHAVALSKLPDEIQIITYQMVDKRPGGATEKRIEAIGAVLTEALATGGYVTTRDGEQSALENAINSIREDQEKVDWGNKMIEATVTRHYIQEDGDYLVLRLSEPFPVALGAAVKVRMAA